MSKQRCKHCGYEWNYKGKYIHKATCPDCKTNTPINRTPEEIEQINLFRELEKELKEEEQRINSAIEKEVGVMVNNNREEDA